MGVAESYKAPTRLAKRIIGYAQTNASKEGFALRGGMHGEPASTSACSRRP